MCTARAALRVCSLSPHRAGKPWLTWYKAVFLPPPPPSLRSAAAQVPVLSSATIDMRGLGGTALEKGPVSCDLHGWWQVARFAWFACDAPHTRQLHTSLFRGHARVLRDATRATAAVDGARPRMHERRTSHAALRVLQLARRAACEHWHSDSSRSCSAAPAAPASPFISPCAAGRTAAAFARSLCQ
jgi:hypothetical protein